ncbi:MAG: hypothetical protein VYD18_17215 [Candidatus Latescibacterota bacterium]|nr:hypothetical protein [Candidatus Latescibacterota bacterium]
MLLSILILVFAFGVLVWTFFWVARLLAARSRREAATTEASVSTDEEAVEETGPTEEEAAEELERTKKGVGVNATLGLILSVLACLLFFLSPLTLVLSVAGLWFSANALWLGFRRFSVFIGRAALGVLLGTASVGLHFGYLTGQFTLPF